MDSTLHETVIEVVKRTAEYLFSIQRADHCWCAEVEANSTLTSEYVMMCQILNVPIDNTRSLKIVRYFKERQNATDGSWSIAHGVEGDVSTTTEAYLALTILGEDPKEEFLTKAKAFIVRKGGPARTRIFTKINLALFGLFSWEDVPVLPAELILLPPQVPVNLYRFSSWARSTIVPLLVINNHRPVYPLPCPSVRQMMDELWPPHSSRRVPYLPPLSQVWEKNGLGWKMFVSLVEPILKKLDKFKVGVIRKHAVSKCAEFILDHQEEEGDTAGILPPMVYGAIALTLEGYGAKSKQVRGFIQAIERFSWESDGQFRIQSCVSPVWDTSLSITALLDCSWDCADYRLRGAIQWMLGKQLHLVSHGDWKVYRPQLEPGAWSFEYYNTWYPDADDTATVLIAILKHNPEMVHHYNFQRGMLWILGMQNKDGGWAAFDVDNDKLFLNDIPFSDMDSLCDPSSPDLAGHVIELLSIYLKVSDEYKRFEPQESLRARAGKAIEKGVNYLRASQEPQGSWFGRWGVNYIYGTSASLCGLAACELNVDDPMVSRALAWLKGCQNEDGGWGESVVSYRDKSTMGRGSESTASQTAWAIMGILAFLSHDDEAVSRGVKWLVATAIPPEDEPEEAFEGGLRVPTNRTKGSTWTERQFTGTGFPNHFYIRYHLYRHYFPMMALGRYLQSSAVLQSPGVH